jgi:hypothetical protein
MYLWEFLSSFKSLRFGRNRLQEQEGYMNRKTVLNTCFPMYL